MKNRLKGKYYLIYSLIFLVAICLVMSVFIVNKRSFVWYGIAEEDGLVQHYSAFVYLGEYLRDIFYNIFISHSFEIPLWDPNVGFGSDIITTFNCYVLGDPLGIFSVFFSPENAEYGYDFLVILRFYLSGLSFLYYCKYMELDRKYSLVGAFVFIFSGYGLYAGVKHPYFMNVMIYFPLILVGIEKIFKDHKPYLFIGMIFISAFSNFYFFYMLSVIMFIYAVLRYLMLFKKIEIKILGKYLLKFIFFYIVGLSLATFTFLPSAMSILNSSRVGIETYLPMFYSQPYYWNMFSSFIATGGGSYWTVLSFSYIAFLSIVVLFLKKGNLPIKIIFLLFLGMLCIPFFGHVFNGFSYFTNRFIWSFSFIVAIITVIALPMLEELNKKEKIIIIAIQIVYFVLCLQHPLGITKTTILPIVFMIFCTVCLLFIHKQYYFPFIMCTVLISVTFNAYFRYSAQYGGFAKEFITSGTAYDSMTNVPSKVIKDVGDEDGYYRFDQKGKLAQEPFNTSLFSKMNSTTFYFSTMNSDITEFLYNDLYYTGNRTEIKYSGLDSRTFLDSLFNVKYYLVDDKNKRYLPYGFDNTVKSTNEKFATYDVNKSPLPNFDDNTQWNAVENSYYVPFGYTYESYIAKDDYKKLSVQQKQESLMQSVVVENNPQNLASADNDYTSKSIEYNISSVKGMKQEGTSFELTEKVGEIEITFDDVENSELYLVLKGVHIAERSPLDIYQKDIESWDNLSKEEQQRLKYYRSRGRYYIKTQCLDTKKKIGIFTPRAESYSGFEDFLINYGYSDEKRNTITLKFDQPGKYSFEDIEVVTQSMDKYPQYVSNLSQNHLENVKIGNNQISGEIALDQTKMLCLSVPYTESWTAYVDGKEVEVEKVNGFMTGLLLDKGKHNIEIRYGMPYKKIVFSLMSFGLVSMIGIIIYENKKTKE